MLEPLKEPAWENALSARLDESSHSTHSILRSFEKDILEIGVTRLS